MTTLKAVAANLETKAGISTTANENESGQLLKVASALESLAGAATTANPGRFGFLLRAVKAAEAVAGTSHPEYNGNEEGLLLRLVTALETKAGASAIGSIERRMGQAAAAAWSAGGSSLTTPTLTLTSATGATPEWDTTLGADIYAGYYLHIEASADGVKNGDGTYTTATQAIDHFITPSDLAAGTISHAELVADGWADPGGAWYLHCWVFREDGVTLVKSGISNELSGTVTGSAAVLATTTGVSKSQYVNVTGAPPLSAAGNASTGAYSGVRSSIGKTGKGHFEVTLTGGSSGDTNGNLWFGVTDASTINMNAVNTKPGEVAGSPGCSFRVKVGGSNILPYVNGAPQTGVALDVIAAVGDKYTLEFDTATGGVNFYQRPVSTGVWGPAKPFTMSTQVPSAPYFGHIGLAYADASCTVNFGATAFSMTPNTGYSGW